MADTALAADESGSPRSTLDEASMPAAATPQAVTPPEPSSPIGEDTPDFTLPDHTLEGAHLITGTPASLSAGAPTYIRSRPTPSTLPPTRTRRKGRKSTRSFLEVLIRKVQKPEVILLSVWWLVTFGLVLYMGELTSILREVWRPMLVILSVPVIALAGICTLSL
mmetsp:Transcript_48016/g.107787  ORF Transcript_48016/g.107787 Transcript_48016/m.107787 type:complete len:165 (-) Transcript_48016:42-536(-)